MWEYDVVYVSLQPGRNDHYSITSLTVAVSDQQWSIPIAEVVAHIRQGAQFHVQRPGGTIDLRVFGAGYV